jgi:hypothetical protein
VKVIAASPMTVAGIASDSLKRCRNPLEWGRTIRVRAKRGKISGDLQAGIRWAKIHNPNREKQKKFKISGSSLCINASGIYFDADEKFSVVSMILTSESIGGFDRNTGSHRSERPQNN